MAAQLGYYADDDAHTQQVLDVWNSDEMVELAARIIERGFEYSQIVHLCEEYGGFGGDLSDQRNFYDIVNELRKVFA